MGIEGCLAAGRSAGPGPQSAWGPIGVLLLIAVVFGFGTLILSALVGRTRRGPVKDAPFESGVEPAGSARRRFNIRYYIVAMIFLLFDVEVVLLFPWAVIFGGQGSPGGGSLGGPGGQGGAGSPGSRDTVLLVEMLVFLLILTVGYVYAWRRGALEFD